ncbi:MAG: Asp-tRNA(Asn)/Glu-tRNA(Gln) amidotransferase subunit GatA [Acetobacteraceae bacterium]|nr:Asp-tRNA(Asn)/Glu-tRNA(Gln) amidotransferase subunit GatA [Acetobacteraceae bacterium]
MEEGLWYLPAYVLAARVARREVSAAEVAEVHLRRLERLEPLLQAFITTTPEAALEAARRVDLALGRGDPVGPLAGVPAAVKDNLCTLGVRTTAGSRILERFVPPYESTATARLWRAGAVPLGKTNLDEFAMGSSTENSAFFPTRNPWDLGRVPGGSSGGSAAAVAAGLAAAALGSDTGGSVRQPAALCGVVGLKPTYGLVSRFGLIAFASSLDQVGVIARTVRDAALVLAAIAGHDPLDSTSAPVGPPDCESALDGEVEGLRLGVPREYWLEGLEEGVRRKVAEAIEVLASLGMKVEECSLPHTEYALPAYYILAPAEASSNLARYDGVRYGHRASGASDLNDMYCRSRREGFGAEVKRRVMLGTYALSSGYYDAYYLKAQKVRTLIRREFEQAFERFDVLATPTSPTTAFPLGERVADPLKMYLSDVLTVPVSLAGLPAVSVPCGLSGGLPVGLQLIAPPLAEARLLRAASAFEQATGHHRARPALDGGVDRR